MNELERVAERSARGSLHLFLGNFLSEIINAVGVVIVARMLTPGEYGVLGLSFVLPGIFVMFTFWGIGSALTRFLARYETRGMWDQARSIIRIGYLFRAATACLISALLFLGAEFLAAVVLMRPDMAGLVRLTSVLVVFQSLYNTSASIFYGTGRMDIMAVLMVVQSVVKTTSSYLFLVWGYGVLGAVIGHILGFGVVTTASVILTVWYTRGKEASTEAMSEEVSINEMLRFGFPLFIGSLIGNLGAKYQGLLLAWFASDAAIGNLNIANKFRSLVTLFTVPISTVVYPAFSKFDYREQPGEMERLFEVSVRYATLLVFPAVALITILSQDFVYFLFDPRYSLAPFLLALSLLQFLGVGLGSISIYKFLNSQGDTVTTFRLNLVNVGIRVAVSTVLTWQLGVPGLLLGLFISELLGRAFNIFVVYQRYGVRIEVAHTVRVVAFSAVSALSTYAALKWLNLPSNLANLTVGAVTFLASCMVLAPLIGAIRDSDIQNISRIMRREPLLNPIVSPLLRIEERIISLRSGKREQE
ncbi:MAG: oligosaccharide flippase family protein [Candidatus Bathyarchaeota archaeon]|nr:MAG: oligosaccharide flippase family protein [Candidatus Bathyarchaeota archaeon]